MSSKTKTTATKEEARPALVPKLRFPEFQNAGEWSKMTLGQAATFYNGRAYKQEELVDSGKYPVLRVGNFFTNKNWYYSDLELDETKYCDDGDLLYAWSASFGPRVWLGDKVIYHYHIWKVEERRGIDRQFLFITLENETERMKAQSANGLGLLHITKGTIEGWESSFPPQPAEQQKIAECLSSVDELMAAQARKVDALKTHKKGLMQQLFPREGETQPRLRFPEFQNAGEWEAKTLVDACRMQAGKFVAAADIKEQNAGDLFPCYGGNGLRGFTATHTHDGVFPLIGRQGALCGNIKLATGRFHATEHAVVATPNRGVEVVWLYYLLDLLNLNRFATGQAQPGLSVDVLEKVPVTIPNDEREQERIATCLSSLDNWITAETQKHEALKTHKKGLMQQLFPSPEEVAA